MYDVMLNSSKFVYMIATGHFGLAENIHQLSIRP